MIGCAQFSGVCEGVSLFVSDVSTSKPLTTVSDEDMDLLLLLHWCLVYVRLICVCACVTVLCVRVCVYFHGNCIYIQTVYTTHTPHIDSVHTLLTLQPAHESEEAPPW